MRLIVIVPIIGLALLIAAWTAPPTPNGSELANLYQRIDALEDRVLDLEHPAYTRSK